MNRQKNTPAPEDLELDFDLPEMEINLPDFDFDLPDIPTIEENSVAKMDIDLQALEAWKALEDDLKDGLYPNINFGSLFGNLFNKPNKP